MRRTVLLAVVLLGLLALAVYAAVSVWVGVGDIPIGAWGLAAMAFGVIATLGLGIGLMRLAYRSERETRDPPP